MKIFIITSVIIIISILGFLLFRESQTRQTPETLIPASTPIPTPYQPENVNIIASFTIITGSITRSFKAAKYHNLSPDVYIETLDPTIVHVTKNGITWDDFFKTLPMKLTRQCLTTGDSETYCEGKEGNLKFYLNNIEDKDLLDKAIKEVDKVLIKFTFH